MVVAHQNDATPPRPFPLDPKIDVKLEGDELLGRRICRISGPCWSHDLIWLNIDVSGPGAGQADSGVNVFDFFKLFNGDLLGELLVF